jgi:hypothetical protein
VASPVTWLALGVAVNLAINSITLLLTLAQNLRLSRYLDMRDYQDAIERRERGEA